MHNAIDTNKLEEWEIINCKTDIESYLPTENKVKIFLDSDQEVDSKRLETFNIPNKSNKNRCVAHVINMGGSIWTLDFVPKTNARPTQYLTLGGYKSTTEQHTLGNTTKYCNTIQIWAFNEKGSQSKPRLDMCILYQFGIISEMQWCPTNHYAERKKLGLLAVLLGDGTIQILKVPHPEKIRKERGLDKEDTIHLLVKKPHLLLTLPRVYNTCMSWGKEFLACGTLSGHIVIWDITQSLLLQKPILHIQIPHADRKPIRSIAWIPSKVPYITLSMDVLGYFYMHDLRDPFFGRQVLRLRSAYSPLLGIDPKALSFVYGDNDGLCRLNTGVYSKQLVTVMTPGYGTVWSLSLCRYCQILASGMSTGEVVTRHCLNNKGEPIRIRRKENVDLLYKLCYNQNSFHYIEKHEDYKRADNRDFHRMLTDPIVAIHKITWNQNKGSCKWIASGGKAGLCRLELLG